MSEPKNKEDKQPSFFGIPFGEKASDSGKSSQLFGIGMAPTEDSNSTPYYLTPAITQSLNLLELTLKKTDFEKTDFETLRATLSLLPISEISRLRSTISLASLDNLSKKADLYEKTQTTENEKSITPNQNQNNESRKLLSQEEINKLMANFLDERNDLAKNLAEKNNQLSLEKSHETKLPN
jgi:hypothetical protein